MMPTSKDHLRLAFDATPLQPQKSGIGAYTENLIHALAATGELAEIVLLGNRPPHLRHMSGSGIRIHEADDFPLRAIWMQTILPRILSKLQPSICHFPNYLAPLRSPCPRVVTLHDMSLYRYPEYFNWKKRYLSRLLLSKVVRRAEGIITVSDFSRREIVQLLGIPERNVDVVYEAPSPAYRPITERAILEEVRRRYHLPDRFILCVATFEPRKNLGRLLAAFENLSRHNGRLKDTGLVLAGGPGWKNRLLKEQIRRVGSNGRLLNLGYFPEEDLPALYSLAHVVAYPSIYEGFGLPIVEGMACGVPVLTSNRASMKEVAGSAAYLVDPEDVDDIRKGLETILLHPDLARELSERGRERASELSWDKAAGETLEVYRRVLRRGTGFRVRLGPPPTAPAEGSGDKGLAAADPSEFRRSVLRTVIYADLFESPMKVEELHRFLIGHRASLAEVTQCLGRDPWVRERVTCRDGYVTLKGREDLIGRIRQQQAATDGLILQNSSILRFLSRVPFLRMLAFSGGTSHKNSPSCHDIDLFLMTAPGRTWTAYALLILFSRLLGRRKVVCMNYFVDTLHRRLPRSGDLFTGHELLYLKPLTGTRWAQDLVESNRWVYDLFPNAGELSREHLLPEGNSWQRFWEIVPWPVWIPFERLAGSILKKRIERRKRASPGGDVVLEEGVLKLHFADRRAPIVQRFRRRLAEAGVWSPSLDRHLQESRAEDPRAAAWNSVSARYDDDERSNSLLGGLRRKFHATLTEWICPGQRVLDLGCGTGIDAMWLLDRGVRVTAIDISAEMIRILREKASRRGFAEKDPPNPATLTASRPLETHVLSLDDLERFLPEEEGLYDGAVANFGSLNCVQDLPRLCKTLARLIRPGGYVVAAVMNRTCAWETLYHLLRVRPRRAFRRWGEGMKTVNVGGHLIEIWYPSPRSFASCFRSEFDAVDVRPHSLLLPPPYLDRLMRRGPRVHRLLEKWEERVSNWSRGPSLADHFLTVMRRRSTGTEE